VAAPRFGEDRKGRRNTVEHAFDVWAESDF
jgi:hypothetical protein